VIQQVTHGRRQRLAMDGVTGDGGGAIGMSLMSRGGGSGGHDRREQRRCHHWRPWRTMEEDRGEPSLGGLAAEDD
jgi:hypothetical protein